MMRLSDQDAVGRLMRITWIASCVSDALAPFQIRTGTRLVRLPHSGIVVRTEEGKTVCIDKDTAFLIGLSEKLL